MSTGGRSSASGSAAPAAAPPILASYMVVKVGHTGATKSRLLCVRPDVVAFCTVDADYVANPAMHSPAALLQLPVKRLIPVPCMLALTACEGGSHLHLLVRNEHDVFFGKADGSPMEDVASLLLKVARMSGNPVPFTKEAGPVDPDEMNLVKQDNFRSPRKKSDLRRAKTKAPLPDGDITLAVWDAIGSPLPFALDPSKMTPQLQRTFAGMHTVMLGSVLVSLAGSSVSNGTQRVLAFTPSRFYVCDEDTGREVVSCCLFSIRSIALHSDSKSVGLTLSDESIPSLSFAIPPTVKYAGAHVSADIGVISNVIRFLLAREGTEVPIYKDAAQPTLTSANSLQNSSWTDATAASVSRSGQALTTSPSLPPSSPRAATPPPQQQQQHSSAGGGGGGAPAARPVTPPAQVSISNSTAGAAASPSTPSRVPTESTLLPNPSRAVQLVPDYQRPHGPVATKFKSVHVLLARQILRLTSKGAWEPRVLVVTNQQRILICDERTNVKRSIRLDQLDELSLLHHWEGDALAMRVHGEHDVVVKLHPELPKVLTVEHIAWVLESQLRTLVTKEETVDSKEKLRDVLLRERPLKKGTTFVSPKQEVVMKRQASMASPMKSSSSLGSGGTATRLSSAMDASGTLPEGDDSSSPSAPAQQMRRSGGGAGYVSTAPPPPPPTEAEMELARQQLVRLEESQREYLFLQEREDAIETLAILSKSERLAKSQEQLRVLAEAAAEQERTNSDRKEEARRRELAGAQRVLYDAFELDRQRISDDAEQLWTTLKQQEITGRQLRLEMQRLKEQLSEVQRGRRDSTSTTSAPAVGVSAAPPEVPRQVSQQDSRAPTVAVHSSTPAPESSTSAAPRPPLSAFRQQPAANTHAALAQPIIATPPPPPATSQSSSTAVGDNTLTTPPSAVSRGVSAVATAPPCFTSASEQNLRSMHAADSSSSIANDTPNHRSSISVLPSTNVQTPETHQPRNVEDDDGQLPPAASAVASTPSFSARKEVVSLFRRTPASATARRNGRLGVAGAANNLGPEVSTIVGGGGSIPAADLLLSLTSRIIVFPTPSTESIPSRGADGSKNACFRIKVGARDAIAVVGNEKFSSALQMRFQDNAPPSGAMPVDVTTSTAPVAHALLDERVICVSTEEPRVACGDLRGLVDLLRTSSLRSWIRRDTVMVRSSNFLWVELGTIPFVVAVEQRGERPAHIADKLLSGGSASSAEAPRSRTY